MTHIDLTYHTYSQTALRLLLLLLLMAGVNGVWVQAAVITEDTYYLNNNTGGTWTSNNEGRYTVVLTDTGTDGGYVSITPVGNGNNGTTIVTKTTKGHVGAGISYILSFDIWLKGGDNQTSWLQINDAEDIAANTNNPFTQLSSSILILAQTVTGGTTWSINGNAGQTVTLTTDHWFHIRIIRSYNKTILTVVDKSNSSVVFNDEIITNSTVGGLGGMEFTTKRYNAGMSIDNLKIMKLGWDVSSTSTYITATDNENKPTTYPTNFYRPASLFPEPTPVAEPGENEDHTAYNTYLYQKTTFSYDNSVIQNTWDNPNYPPRLKTTGTGIVTGSFYGLTSVYTMTVYSSNGGGEYTPSTHTYTFNTVGTVSYRTIEDVPGITMSFRGGPTAMVVDRNGTKYLKTIDVNGYSHPNLNNGASTIPPENNWGGTFYKFVPSANGKLSFTGNFDYMKLYESDGTTLKARAETGTSATDISLEIGKTYYLYNAGSNGNGSAVPLLHSFTYTPDATSLTFRNPQPVINVDINEGSYTNPAISAVGLPVTYTVISGPATVTDDGKVTFNSGLINPSYTVTVKASTAASGDYAAAAASYTLNLVRRTWIFDNNSKWSTTQAELTSWQGPYNYISNGLQGSSFMRHTQAIDYAELTKDGTNVLPETEGLLFNKVSGNDRLYIAPKDYSPNFLAMRATFIAIDDVQAGQTVTVDWYGGNSSAVLDISDAVGENVRDTKRGPTSITATQTGRVTIASNAIVSYIRSIKVSTPTRAIGTLTYAKTVLSGTNTQTLTSYTITDETGATDLSSAYYAPQYFSSSNPSVVSVDANTGQIEAHSTAGVAVITATAIAKNSATHQETVTLVATIEVVENANTRIRTIDIDDLLYTTNVNANNGLNRRIPGFDIAFEGGDGAKCNNASSVILRNGTGKMTITPRAREGETVTITKALVTVKSATDSPSWKINGGSGQAVSAGGVTLESLSGNSLMIESVSGSIEITDIKIYYNCSNADNADYCLDDSKVAPAFNFSTPHFMRIPGDGRSFTQSPTVNSPSAFNASFTYTSSATAVATINADGTSGQLHISGEAAIIATFNETKYFAQSTTQYTVSNTLLSGEQYDGIAIASGQFIHITASASAENTALTLIPDGPTLNMSSLTYGKNQERKNTFAQSTGNSGTVTLKNETNNGITVYSYLVVSPIVKAWLYYEGQEENYAEQVQFTGFSSGAVKGFRVIDIGDPNNIIDLTDAYVLKSGTNYEITSGSLSVDGTTGEISVMNSVGNSTLKHLLSKKTGAADGYDDEVEAESIINVLNFDATNPVVWTFANAVTYNGDTGGQLGQNWTWDNRGSADKSFYYGYFSDYMPILIDDERTPKPGLNGILLKDEFRLYSNSRGLRANLSAPNSSIKFPVKAGMEIDIEVATASADITHIISNVTDIEGNDTDELFIQIAGDNNNIHAYYLAKTDGCVEIQSTDKVGMYLKSITLKVPEIHFTDDIVTVLNTASSTVKNATTNVPTALLQYLNYEILSGYSFDADGNEEAVANVSTLASIDNTANSPTKGVVTLTGTEGWITVKVTNTNPNPNNLEPREGTYKLYAVDFRFAPTTETLDLDSKPSKEIYFDRRPVGINKVATPINYSFEIPSSSNAKAMLRQTTNPDPALTTYQLTAYNKGIIIVKAKTGRIETTCTLTATGHTFEKVVDVLSESDIADNSYVYTIKLPDYYNNANKDQWSLTWAYEGEFPQTPDVSLDLTGSGATPGKLKIKNLYGTSTTNRNHGAIRFIARHNSGNYTQFVLTLAYPASSGKKWDFYRSTTGLKAQTDHDNKIGDYEGTHLNSQTVTSYTITDASSKTYTFNGAGEWSNTDGWTTDATWNKIYRNGDKEPRWAYGGSVKCDNAFIIEETAGLQIEAPHSSFYVDNNTTAAYCHVGLHSRSTITVPKLKRGDFVRLNLSRVIPNNGAIIEAKNVTDLADKPVTEVFTISRSQIDYKENGMLATDDNGSRIIPGYYTFKVAADGDVSFTLADEGYLDVLSVEIYDKDVTDTYLGTKADDGYQHTLTAVKSTDAGYPYAKTVVLKENDDIEEIGLAFCHPMWSTSTGPANYVLRGGPTTNLDADLSRDPWMSGGGVWYENGLITARQGYGKITVRMNNYTADRKYLIGYSPDYTVTVGHKPHQDYPYTWNFTNISGGEVKGDYNNAYNSVSSDASTWTNRGDNVIELDTDTEGGSFYVPGATLVSTPRDLGMKGTKTELDAAGTGCDEFNGLGFNGQVMFKTAAQSGDDPESSQSKISLSLLEYKLNDSGFATETTLTAGNGSIYFKGNRTNSGITTEQSTCGYAFKLDQNYGENKYVILTPNRAFEAGDVLEFKVFTNSTPHGDDFGLLIYLNSTSSSPLTSVFLPEGQTKNKEATISYTVRANDGVCGLTSIYVYRNTNLSIFINEVKITKSYPATKQLYAVAPTTVTIPDLNADGKQDWIYIKSSKAPTAITNATLVESGSDGPDANTGVYKYKVTAPGNSDVTFNGDTEIDQIGVTHILKQMTRAGDKAWATESRDHSIDHSLTGYFTLNDVNVHTVTKNNETTTAKRTVVKLNAIAEDGYVPGETGLVMRLDGLDNADNLTNYGKTNNYDSSNGTGRVPLFYPAMTTGQTITKVSFPSYNLMYPNLTEQELTSETENVGVTDYTRFILAKRYMEWKKENNAVVNPTGFESQEAAVFYRLHLYGGTTQVGSSDKLMDENGNDIIETSANELNTLGANKAYLLLPTSSLPDPLWNANSPSRPYIAILGVSDYPDYSVVPESSSATYNLKGQAVNDNGTLRPGLYIRNGRKIIVK